MRRSVTALLLIATLHVRAVASPPATGEPTHDRDGRPRASSGSGPTFDPTFDPTSVLTPAATTTAAAASPWIDEAPTPLLDPRPLGDRSHRKRNSVLILGGLYAGFIGWTYLAWYRKDTHEFRWGGDVPDGGAWYRWFDTHTYAAGADKLGHAWATLGLARAGTELLNQYGGYSRLSSAIVGTSLSQALFLGVEIKDGFAYSFSIGDFAFNTAGAVLAFAQSMWPRVDEFVDLRVEYLPSKAYRRLWTQERNIDWAEDYTGQTYLLAFHLGAIHALRDTRYLGWSRFVDVAIGFDTDGYKPDPPYRPTVEMPDYDKQQRVFIGVSLNAQGLFDALLRGRAEGLRKVTHGTFEMFNIPFTSAPLLEKVRMPTGTVPNDGA